jgi:hypothetical protein
VIPKEKKVKLLQRDVHYGWTFWGVDLKKFLERAMRNNPGYLKEEFELYFFNEDILHTTWVTYIINI